MPLSFQIATDSTTDLTAPLYREHSITVLPLHFAIDGTEFLDGWSSMTPEKFFGLLRSGKISTTSAVNFGQFIEAFTPILERGEDILYLGFTGALSSTSPTAEIAAVELRAKYPARRIVVIDTLCASAGEGLLVLLAARRRDRGESLEQTADWVREHAPRVQHWFTVDSLSHLYRGGRLSAVSAIVGGALGIGVIEAMKRGVSRGVFSNEAGLGSAPMAHAAAETPGPIQQGLYGIFEVFADTTVICTMTSLVILMSGTPIEYGQPAGVELTNAAFAMTYGKYASVVVAIGLSLFAGSTILSWGLYGTRCAEYLFGSKVIKPYQILFCIVVVMGAVMDLSLAWDISDTLNACMAIPNLIGLLLLSPVVIKLAKEYSAEHFPEKQKA